MNFSRRACRLMLLLALGLLPLASATPAQGATGLISIFPTSGSYGTQVTVTGSGFNAGSTYTVLFDGASVATGAVSGSGTISALFVLGGSYARGGHPVTVTTTAPDDSNTLTFDVTPRIILDNTSGQVGDQILINGLGFSSSAEVTIYFDDNVITSTTADTVGSFAALAATIPQSYQGSHSISAADSIGYTLPTVFTVYPKMLISPATAPVGGEITAYGTGFAANSNITFFIDDSLITSSTVTTDSNGSFTSAGAFKIPVLSQGTYVFRARDGSNNTVAANLTITQGISISPQSGSSGTTIQITGNGFGVNKIISVSYDGVNIATDPTTIYTDDKGSFSAIFIVPVLASGSYIVTAADDTSSSTTTLKVIAGVSISPTSGPSGTNVTVKGGGFSSNGTILVSFDGVRVGSGMAGADGAFSINFNIPISRGGNHPVTVIDSLNSVTLNFTITPTSSLSPASGYAGSDITVSGTGFLSNKPVNLSYDFTPVTTLTTDAKGTFNAVFKAPASPTGNHALTATDGVSNVTLSFSIVPGINLTPGSGFVGSSITITGTGFASAGTIKIKYDDGQAATALADNNGSFTSTFKAPSSRSGNHTVSASDGVSNLSLPFRAVASMTLTADNGNVGSNIGVSGTGFAPAANVALKYDNIQIGSPVTDASGAFTAAFQAPPSKGGSHLIAATDGANTVSSTFVMDSTPPAVPKLLTPADASKVEPLTSLVWSTVADPSGVTYTLQIATDATFSNIILEKSGLNNPGYTLAESEKLKSVSESKPYFWRVKAVDGASNESSWIGAQSFYVGFVAPAWSLYIAFGVAVILAGLFGYWFGRKKRFQQL